MTDETIDALDLGRARLATPRLGRSLMREADADLLAIRALIAEVERLRAAPVKPDREAVARALYAHRQSVGDFPDGFTAWEDLPESWRAEWLDAADAVLALLPGRTEAEVKAEALRGFAARVRDEVRAGDERLGRGWATDEYRNGLHIVLIQADEAADRLAAEGGAS